MYTYVKKHGSCLLVRETGDIIKKVSSYDFRVFFETSENKGDYKNIDGQNLDFINFSDLKSADNYVCKFKNNKSANLYGAKNFDYYYIRDMYHEEIPISISDIYIANIDIETGRDDKGYSSPEESRCPITAITLEDMNNSFYHVWGWGEGIYDEEKSEIDVKKKYYHFSTETDMLINFIAFWSSKYPDIITGWNCNRYDIPYIINRIYGIFDNDADMLVNKLSPFGKVYNKTKKDQFNKEYDIYDILGISLLDYMELFKKFTFKTPENYKLDTVAHMVLGDRKLDYSDYTNLQDLCNNNYQLFIDYNIKDVNIIHRLDNRLHLFDLVLSLAYKAGINYVDVVSPVTTWDVLIYNVLMDDNIVPPININDNINRSYIGAHVKEPIPGLYKWVLSCDLNSLYPHLQMGINISPEKRLIESEITEDLKHLRDNLGDTIEGIDKLLNEDIDISILKNNNVCIAPNGEFYHRNGDGFIPVILEGLYNERKAVKRSMLDDKQLMENDSSLDLSDQIESKNTLQMALKILMNSEYGALANKYFRYFDLRNAEAVTSSGQLAILWVAKYLNKFLNRILKTNEVDYIIAIDTDSVYLNLESLVNKFIPQEVSKDKIVDIIDKWTSEILEPEISRIYDKLANYINAHKQKMVMAREVIADAGFWSGKKRYALNVYDNEGVRYSTPKCKIMGLECVRSSTPEYIRNKIEECIKIILTKDESYFQSYMANVDIEFFNKPYDDIAFPRGVNDIEKWNDNGIPKKGCPIAVRGAIIYNKFIDDNNLVDAEKIQSGDKIKFVYLKKPNIFKSHVLSYPPMLAKEVHDNLELFVDFDKQLEGSFKKPIEMYCSCIGWEPEKQYSVLD